MAIFVTGGAGFIGSHLVKELTKENEVVVFDDLSSGKLKNLPQDVRFVKGDIRNLNTLRSAMAGAELVYHLAARISVPESIEKPSLYHDVNVNGTLNVLLAARDVGVKKLIFVSSASVYGKQERIPIKESAQLKPASPYALSKVIGEHYCKLFSELYGLKVIVLRLFNVYGIGCTNYAAVIPTFICRALDGGPLEIFGDGFQSRDFVWVGDVVRALIAAAERGQGIINIGSGQATTINELARLILKLTNGNSEIVHCPPRAEVRHSVAHIEQAKEILNWTPKISLVEGIKNVLQNFEKAK